MTTSALRKRGHGDAHIIAGRVVGDLLDRVLRLLPECAHHRAMGTNNESENMTIVKYKRMRSRSLHGMHAVLLPQFGTHYSDAVSRDLRLAFGVRL